MSAPGNDNVPVLCIGEGAGTRSDEADSRPDQDVDGFLREVQRLIFKYPIASQAMIATLAAEGRRFASTNEGREWLVRLAASDLYRKGRELWHVGTFGAFGEKSADKLPSAMVDAFVQAVRSGDLQSILSAFTGGDRR